MRTEKINISRIKQNLIGIPFEKLPAVNNSINSVLTEAGMQPSGRTEKLEGLWEGISFERISDPDGSIREIRNLSQKALEDRIAKWNI